MHYALPAQNIYAGITNDSRSVAGSRLIEVYGMTACPLAALPSGRATGEWYFW